MGSVPSRIRSARRAGACWAQIGAALGMSKQSAWEAHSPSGWTSRPPNAGDPGSLDSTPRTWQWAQALAGDSADKGAD